MRHFQPLEAVIEALRESTFVELTDNDTRVRRKELPADWDDPNKITVFEDAAMPRSVYVKGFGEEVPSTQFDIEAFFAEYGPTKAVRLRRTNDKLFKGSVFVEFETEEVQKAFLELDPKPKFKGNDLQIMSKKEYCEKKADDIKEGKIQPNQRYDQGRRNDRSGRDSRRKREAEDNRDWRTRRDEDRKRGFGDDKRRGDRDSRSGRGGRSNETARDDRSVALVALQIGTNTNVDAEESPQSSLRLDQKTPAAMMRSQTLEQLLQQRIRRSRRNKWLRTMWSRQSKTVRLMLRPRLRMLSRKASRQMSARLQAKRELERMMTVRVNERRRRLMSSRKMFQRQHLDPDLHQFVLVRTRT